MMSTVASNQGKLCAAVFISDLHLHPEEPLITERFNAFVKWAAVHTDAVYILGDFFHVWAGDDGLDAWSKMIAERLFWLSRQQVAIYFMHGNRDFLLGQQFANLAGMAILPEPTIIRLGEMNVLLVHGDRYCTNDKSHQWFRQITRNRWFSNFFLRMPYVLRSRIVGRIRQYSQRNRTKPSSCMAVIVPSMIKHMRNQQVTTVIHGHTHNPGLMNYCYNKHKYSQYVLSDWDDNPTILCYSKTMGIYFDQLNRLED